MRNVNKKIMNSWYALLNGHLNNNLPVYIESVPESENGNYVLLRAEGETDLSMNDKTWIKSVVVVVDIITRFEDMIDTSEVDDIDNEIGVLLTNGPFSKHNLSSQTGIIINSVTDETSTYLNEGDGPYYYRKVTRYNHLVTIKI